MSGGRDKKLIVMVSSTVFDIRDLLDQVYGTLTGFGYDVWMSARGTVPVNPGKSNFENCLKAVEACDLFFGIITPAYGSGKETADGLSITHREMLKAIEIDKPRWIVCQEGIMTARTLLNDLSFDTDSLKGAAGRRRLTLRSGSSILRDLKVIDMLEAAMLEGKPVAERTGNWVQPYARHQDVLMYVEKQFGRVEDVRRMLGERALPAMPEEKTKRRPKTKTKDGS